MSAVLDGISIASIDKRQVEKMLVLQWEKSNGTGGILAQVGAVSRLGRVRYLFVPWGSAFVDGPQSPPVWL